MNTRQSRDVRRSGTLLNVRVETSEEVRALNRAIFVFLGLSETEGSPVLRPSPPTRLAAITIGTTVTLAWEPSAELVSSYTIEAGSRDGAADLARIGVPGDRTRFTTEAPPDTFFVRVRADTPGGPSGPTPDVWLTVGQGTLPPAPTGLTVTGAVPMHTASWQPGADAHYVLEVGSGPRLADVARIVTAPHHCRARRQ